MAFVTSATLVPALATAQHFPFERSFDVTGPSKIDVATLRGKIDVVAGGPNRIVVTGEVTVRIVDQCPECPQGDVDLSPDAFAKIAELSLGRVDISWQYIPCAVSGSIVYRFKEGSNQWWTALQIRNHRNAVAKLEYEKDGTYVSVARETYNYFVEPNGMGPGPYTFRLTDVYGHVVTGIVA